MLTSDEIAQGKRATARLREERLHEHDDCIRIAYEWLDAQVKLKRPRMKARALKHIIENWAGRYVSQSDVEVAAYLHPDIIGEYPYYNLSARFIEPRRSRLDGIEEAGRQPNYNRGRMKGTYSAMEPD
jgi:hypothetical protein